ncbi:MAG: HAMP domain-containing protein [Clostridiaceae bacterium]|jgi:signal transduction histidine kinase|nr:HAMP domain-containing protein [Clostridiaceae bacterium]
MMLKTMFSKILALVISVLVISFIITGVIMNYSLNNMVTEQKAQQLEEISEKVITALDTSLKRQTLHDPYLFTSFIQTLANNNDSLIWIVGDDGAIIFYSDIPDYLHEKLDITDDGWFSLPDERQYSILSSKFEVGDFFGLFKNTGVDWVTHKQHFTISNIPPYDMNASGVILIHTKVPSIYRLKSSIIVMFIISGLLGGMISLLLSGLLSRRITRPVNQIKLAARRVASGEFSGRINVKGKDEIAELSDSFNDMVLALENLERMRRDFIGNVSHELRTPITTIKGFIDGILDGVIPAEKQEYYLSIVRDEVRRMQNLVNDLLDLAKMQAGEVILNMTDFDINELIRHCVISLQQLLIEKNLEFKADFETERLFVHADMDSIQRVLINLLHNAIKFTPVDGEIRIKTYLEKDKAVISVEDTGSGIPKDELPNIFERFYKTDKSRSTDRSGVGLGLAIARNIIVSHNESIKVESEEGHGSRFIFTLCRASESEQY